MTNVYLFWAVGTFRFKIGYTARNIQERFKAVQSMSPLPLYVVGRIDGGKNEELRLHRKFHTHRVNGEWFEFNYETDMIELLQEFSPNPKWEDNDPICLPIIESVARRLHKEQCSCVTHGT